MNKPVSLDNAALHDSKEDISTNPTNNKPFAEIVSKAVERRTVLKGSLTAAAAGYLAPAALLGSSEAEATAKKAIPVPSDQGLCNFTPVTIADVAAGADSTVPYISPDYEYHTLIPWGTHLSDPQKDYTGDPSTRPTSDDQAEMIGIGHDGMWLYPKDIAYAEYVADGYVLNSSRGILAINHEFGTDSHVLGKSDPESLEDVRLSQHAHGVSVVEIYKVRGENRWELERGSPYNRRIHVNTPVEFSGPAAEELEEGGMLWNMAENEPAGTVNNCGSGPTLWGTYITCEENFNGYFGYLDPTYERDTSQLRYGFDFDGFGYGWYNYDPRFDLSNPMYANECNRFGWCVEIDPMNPEAKPVKRTAMGRVKHEAMAMKEITGGRVACYMGDDQRFDYCYKYESMRPWKVAQRLGESPLDKGRLYVARFNEDGTGEWLELTIKNQILKKLFKSQADILINTRLAADALGATPMDRPEWTTIGSNGEVIWTLTNNSNRDGRTVDAITRGRAEDGTTNPTFPGVADAANPEQPNSDGHIIRTVDKGSKHFIWDIYMLSSDTRGTEGVFTDPDAAWADDEGRLFIGTDGGQPDGLQDQLTVIDTTSSVIEPKRLFVGVNRDEITGYATTPDYKWAFINVQHPGNGDPSRTNFPAPTDGETIPRDCTVVIWKRTAEKSAPDRPVHRTGDNRNLARKQMVPGAAE